MSITFRVLLHPRASKELDGLPSNIRERVKSELRLLSGEPERGTPLNPSRFRRIRAGNYRAIYEIDEGNRRVIVLFVGHRKNVYDEFRRLL